MSDYPSSFEDEQKVELSPHAKNVADAFWSVLLAKKNKGLITQQQYEEYERRIDKCTSIGQMMELADDLDIGDAELRLQIERWDKSKELAEFAIKAGQVLYNHGASPYNLPKKDTRENYIKAAKKLGMGKEQFLSEVGSVKI